MFRRRPTHNKGGKSIKQLIDIGGRHLEVSIRGKGHPVILLTGMVSSMAEWESIANDLAENTEMILFHRAGFGNSSKGSNPANLYENVKDLKKLIDILELKSPVIVGHSYGGLFAQLFVHTYPDTASALVLVDSSSTDSHLLDEVEMEGNDDNSMDAWMRKCRDYSKLTPSQLHDELSDWIYDLQASAPVDMKQPIQEFMSNPFMFATLAEELEWWRNHPLSFDGFPQIPVTVIGRDPKVSIQEMIEEEGISETEAEKIEEIWQYLITLQTKMSEKTTYVLAENSGHDIHTRKPDVIKQETLKVIEKILN
ncbi:alpha/beta fold hydrolase [Halobacillus rhizosphaerae]|uniref:alpha/beta hydrolase n=1 Tax=Halobacillus rhizosphaerae TaxID=3064889 RepID=UPI00398B972F